MNSALSPCKMGMTATPLCEGTVRAAGDGYEAVLTPRGSCESVLRGSVASHGGPPLEAVQQCLEEATCLPTASLSRRLAAEALVTGMCHSPTCSSPSPASRVLVCTLLGTGNTCMGCQRRGLPEDAPPPASRGEGAVWEGEGGLILKFPR